MRDFEEAPKRLVKIGSREYSFVLASVDDEADFMGISHTYRVKTHGGDECAVVKFQSGPIKEHGVNGCHHEDLLAIVLDRLQQFQAGDFACRENALAITKLEEALHWLNHRTQERKNRGVEKTNSV